jgi:hypothetical protein
MKRLIIRLSFFALFSMCIYPSLSHSEIIYVIHKYVMGDNDSRNDARKMCFLEAKRKVIEKAGTYIESLTEVKNAKLSKDEILAYSSALLKVETVKEDWKMSGDNMAVILKVKADVATGNLKKKLSNIRKDKSIQKKVIEQQEKLRNLEKTVLELQKQLGSVDSEKASTLRKDRNIAFKQIDELENKRVQILYKIKKKSNNVIKYIERGMTMKEVISISGKPRSREYFLGYIGYHLNQFNYGTVWVIFESEIVSCIVKSQCFEKARKCKSYSELCIVK